MEKVPGIGQKTYTKQGRHHCIGHKPCSLAQQLLPSRDGGPRDIPGSGYDRENGLKDRGSNFSMLPGGKKPMK
jgi:hypothetical protein